MSQIINADIEIHKDKIQLICENNNVKCLYFFGSIVDPLKFNENSDIDVLVSFDVDIGHDEYTDSYFRLLFELEELFEREVDIVTERSVQNPYFMQELEHTKVLFYDSLTEIHG